MNSRHPDPRRAWKGGAEPRVVDQIRGIPADPRDPGMNSQPLIPFEAVFKKSCKKALAGMLPGNLYFFGEKKDPAGMLPGNPDFVGEKQNPAGMLPGNPDFYGGEKAPAGMLAWGNQISENGFS